MVDKSIQIFHRKDILDDVKLDDRFVKAYEVRRRIHRIMSGLPHNHFIYKELTALDLELSGDR